MSGCCAPVGSLEWALAGARGLLNSVSATHRESDAEIQRRRDICRGCPNRTRSASPRHAKSDGLTTLSICTRCVCNIAAKTSLKAESGGVCCAGKW